MPTFTPPTRLVGVRLGKGRPIDRFLFARLKTPVGLTVVKRDGFYKQFISPDPDVDLAGADAVYFGGHTYQITQDEADSLTAAGYTVSP